MFTQIIEEKYVFYPIRQVCKSQNKFGYFEAVWVKSLEDYIHVLVLHVIVQLLSHIRLFVTPWTAAHQASLSFTFFWGLLRFMSIESVMHPTISSSVSPFSSHLQSFPASRSFPMFSQLFLSGGQSIGASASVLPVTIQGWFPLGWTGLNSLLSKGLSRAFYSMTIWKHRFFSTQASLWSSLHVRTWLWKNHSCNYTDLCWPSDVCFLIH